MSCLQSHKSVMLPQTWDKVWHPGSIRGCDCPQYRCPSWGRMGRESSLLIPGLKKRALCIQDLLLSVVRNVVERPGIGTRFFPFPVQWGWSKTGSHLAGFQCLIHNEMEQGRRGPQPNFQWTLQTSLLQGSKQYVPAWRLSFPLHLPGSSSRTWIWRSGWWGERESLQEAVPLLCLSWRWAKQVAELPGYPFHPAPNSRERIIPEKATCARKAWDSQECYQGWQFLLSPFAVERLAVGEREQGTFA